MTAQPRRGRPPLSEPHRAAVRRAIAHEAVRLFAARGVAATSGDDIARAAGVSPRTLWRYFATKESCVRPLLATGAEALTSTLLAQPPERSLAEAFHAALADGIELREPAAVVEVVRLARSEPGIHAVWSQAQVDAEPPLAEAIGRRLSEAADGLRPRMLAAVVNAALRVAVESHAWAPPGTGRGLDEALREALRTAARALPVRPHEPEPAWRLSLWSDRQARLQASDLTVHQYGS